MKLQRREADMAPKKKQLSGREGTRYGHVTSEDVLASASRGGRGRAGAGAGGADRFSVDELMAKAEDVLSRGEPELALKFYQR